MHIRRRISLVLPLLLVVCALTATTEAGVWDRVKRSISDMFGVTKRSTDENSKAINWTSVSNTLDTVSDKECTFMCHHCDTVPDDHKKQVCWEACEYDCKWRVYGKPGENVDEKNVTRDERDAENEDAPHSATIVPKDANVTDTVDLPANNTDVDGKTQTVERKKRASEVENTSVNATIETVSDTHGTNQTSNIPGESTTNSTLVEAVNSTLEENKKTEKAEQRVTTSIIDQVGEADKLIAKDLTLSQRDTESRKHESSEDKRPKRDAESARAPVDTNNNTAACNGTGDGGGDVNEERRRRDAENATVMSEPVTDENGGDDMVGTVEDVVEVVRRKRDAENRAEPLQTGTNGSISGDRTHGNNHSDIFVNNTLNTFNESVNSNGTSSNSSDQQQADKAKVIGAVGHNAVQGASTIVTAMLFLTAEDPQYYFMRAKRDAHSASDNRDEINADEPTEIPAKDVSGITLPGGNKNSNSTSLDETTDDKDNVTLCLDDDDDKNMEEKDKTVDVPVGVPVDVPVDVPVALRRRKRDSENADQPVEIPANSNSSELTLPGANETKTGADNVTLCVDDDDTNMAKADETENNNQERPLPGAGEKMKPTSVKMDETKEGTDNITLCLDDDDIGMSEATHNVEGGAVSSAGNSSGPVDLDQTPKNDTEEGNAVEDPGSKGAKVVDFLNEESSFSKTSTDDTTHVTKTTDSKSQVQIHNAHQEKGRKEKHRKHRKSKGHKKRREQRSTQARSH